MPLNRMPFEFRKSDHYIPRSQGGGIRPVALAVALIGVGRSLSLIGLTLLVFECLFLHIFRLYSIILSRDVDASDDTAQTEPGHGHGEYSTGALCLV